MQSIREHEKDVISTTDTLLTHTNLTTISNKSIKMKLASFVLLSALSSAAAFAPSAGPARSFALKNQLGNSMDTSGNAWKPDSEKMVRSLFVGNLHR